ncbi:REPLICATION FACTOR A 1 RFA1 [Salix koriyanagi]|uniref:REPLICATION FACTOR A 1 RFA1 n=1 Tax=Salix koriyanagi TaxID=2511006 RepID=A0A9Q0VDY8_9ROSI|nr:REPLICATION FACTOR A 1 RFA1 [Salix koriyanagi]
MGDIFEATSTLDLFPEEDSSIPQQQFKPISEIEISENKSILDVFRVVVFVNPSAPILRKNGMETQERILKLKDGSGRTADYQFGEILATRKGQKLKEMVDSGGFPVLAVKAEKVSSSSSDSGPHKIDLGNSIPGVRGGDTGLPSKEIIHEVWKMHMMIPDLRT